MKMLLFLQNLFPEAMARDMQDITFILQVVWNKTKIAKMSLDEGVRVWVSSLPAWEAKVNLSKSSRLYNLMRGHWSHSCVQQLDRRNWAFWQSLALESEAKGHELPWRPEPSLSTALPQDKVAWWVKAGGTRLACSLLLGTTPSFCYEKKGSD